MPVTRKKTFENMARCLREVVEEADEHQHDILRQVAIAQCTWFREDNPAFDVKRFMTAAGFDEREGETLMTLLGEPESRKQRRNR